MNPQALPLRDIKPLLPIPDLSIYLLVLVVLVVLIGVGVAIYLFWHRYRMRHKVDPRLAWLAELDRIDYDHPKEAAYTITKYGRRLAQEKRQKEIYHQLLTKLERYKYQKSVPLLDEETKRYMRLFIQMCHDAV